MHVQLHAARSSRTAAARMTRVARRGAHDGVLHLPARRGRRGARSPSSARRSTQRVAVHIGCHGLRGLGLAKPSELQDQPFDKVRALLGAVRGLELAELARPDECCGFGGTFAVGEPAVSAKMGRDRLRDSPAHGAEARRVDRHVVPDAPRRARAARAARAADVPRRRGAGAARRGAAMTQRASSFRCSASRAGAITPRPPRRSTPTSRAPTGTTTRSGSCARSATAPPRAVPEWEALRERASAIKEHALSHLDEYLEQFEANAHRATACRCTGRATRTSTTGSCTAFCRGAAPRGS